MENAHDTRACPLGMSDLKYDSSAGERKFIQALSGFVNRRKELAMVFSVLIACI